LPYHRTITTRPNQTTWGRFRDTLRSYTIGLPPLRDPALVRYFDGGGATSAGVAISETSALNYAAVWQAVSLISGDVGSLPLPLYKKLKGGGKERYTEHPLYYILHDSPNPEMSSMVWRETLQGHLLTWGNNYSEIVRNGAGQVSELWPMLPSQVSPFRQDGRLKYRIVPDSGREVILESFDVLHVPGLGFDGTIGYSPIMKARESLGLLAASERFGASFYGNGTAFGGFLTHPRPLSEKAEKNLRESLSAGHQGPDKAHRLKILEDGMTFQQAGVEPNAAQFLETRKFQITEVCRWFNLSPSKLRELDNSSVRANIEQDAIDYVQSTLRPWLVRWEQEINRKLISPRERYIQSAEFVIDGLLRGDFASRYAGYAVGRQWGWLSVNEIRALENLNPISDGNTYLSPMNMTPADRLNEVIDAQIKPKPAPAQAQPADKAEDDGERQALRAQVLQQVEIIQKLQAADEAARTTIGALESEIDERGARGAAELAAAREARAGYQQQHERSLLEISSLSTRCMDQAKALESAQADRMAIGAALNTAEERLAEVERAANTAELRADKADAAVRQLHDQLQDAVIAWHETDQERGRHKVEAFAWQDKFVSADSELTAALVARAEATLAHEQAIADMDAANQALATRCEAQDKALEEARADRALAIRHRDEETETGAQAEQARDEAIANAAALSVTAEAADMRAQVAEARALLAESARDAAVRDAGERLTAVITANRAIVLDTMTRLVAHEVDKARKQQASPAKLRSWIQTFYPQYEQVCGDRLLPVVAAHMAVTGATGEPAEMARTLAREYVQESIAQLEAVADCAPAEDLSANLAGVTTRWERQRPDTFADRFVRAEIAAVRNLR
jgi:HK97 family phage portal protein